MHYISQTFKYLTKYLNNHMDNIYLCHDLCLNSKNSIVVNQSLK